MRILVLDDQEERHSQIKAKHGRKHEITHVYLWSEFEKALEGDAFNLILLDHDLGDLITQERKPGMYSQGDEYNGVDAAFAVAALPPNKLPSLVGIHSWNADGAKRMQQTLANVVRVRVAPFGSLNFWSLFAG